MFKPDNTAPFTISGQHVVDPTKIANLIFLATAINTIKKATFTKQVSKDKRRKFSHIPVTTIAAA